MTKRHSSWSHCRTRLPWMLPHPPVQWQRLVFVYPQKTILSLNRSHSRPNDANFLSNGCGCTSNDIENEVEEKTWSPSLRQNLSPLAKFAKESSFSLISALLAAGWCWPVSGVPHQSKQSHSFCYHYDDCEVQLMSYKCVPLSQEPVL